ncbi:MAG: O-antigen ligase family protein [Candidatus Komeilibacteria bacterium]
MLNLILIAIFYLFFIILAWPRMQRGIYLTILLLPTYLIRFQIFNIPATLLEGMVVLLFIMWVIKLWQSRKLHIAISAWFKKFFKAEEEKIATSKRNLIPKIIALPIFIFFLASIIALITTPQTMAGAGIWKAYFLEPLMFLGVLLYYIRKNSEINKLIYTFSVLSIIIFIYALIQKLTGWNIPVLDWYLPETRRVTTFFGYPNANGLLLAPIGALIFATLWIKEYTYLKILKFIAFISIIFTIIWASSEGALIALSIGVFIILLAKKHTRLLAIVLAVILYFVILITPSLRSVAFEKITISDYSGQIRRAQWTETISMLKDNPFTGGGLANYQEAVKQYHSSGITINDKWQPVEVFLYPHNIILNFWTEVGILGLISTLWLFIILGVLIYRINIKKKWLPIYKKEYITHLSLGVGASLIVIIIHGIVDVPYFKNDLSILFWLIVGITIVLYNHTVNKKLSQLE